MLAGLSAAMLHARLIDDVFDDGFDQTYAPYVELGGIGGDFPETGTTFLFAPLWQTPDEMFFADLRGLYNDLAEVEGNWGLGYRRIVNDDTIFGVYGYYDQRLAHSSHRWLSEFSEFSLTAPRCPLLAGWVVRCFW